MDKFEATVSLGSAIYEYYLNMIQEDEEAVALLSESEQERAAGWNTLEAIQNMGITSVELETGPEDKKYFRVMLKSPGFLIGPKGRLINFIQEKVGVVIKIKEDSLLDNLTFTARRAIYGEG
jgi:ribosomal protein S3